MAKRVSALDARLRELGGEMEDWIGMDVPMSFPTDPNDERDAVRDGVGMWDTSALKKIHIRGAGALATVDHLATRDMTKIYVGKSAYTPVLQDNGHFCDDAYIYHLDDDDFLLVHGGGTANQRVEESAAGKSVSVEFDDDLHMISVQGPKSVTLLDAHCSGDLGAVAFCHQIATELFGKRVTISRTGFSGERGYEVMVQRGDALEVFDQILEHGKPMGLLPVSFAGLDILHVESALIFYGADATEEHTPWEVGCGWAISRKKGDFRGREALFALEGKEKVRLCGIEARHDGAVDAGAELLRDGRKVGTVASPAYSRALGKSIATCHVALSAAAPGTRLEVKGENVACAAEIVPIPFYDPEKKRLHAA